MNKKEALMLFTMVVTAHDLGYMDYDKCNDIPTEDGLPLTIITLIQWAESLMKRLWKL